MKIGPLVYSNFPKIRHWVILQLKDRNIFQQIEYYDSEYYDISQQKILEYYDCDEDGDGTSEDHVS